MPQINDIRELAQQNAGYVSNSPQDWMSYLDVAARLYRYSFTDTLLIHAQRPDATACAELELWNQKMSRWVNRGAKGIALLDDTGPRTKLRYVFDIADTHLVRGGRTPLLWNLDSHEHEQTILDHLADTYGLSQTDSMNTALMELAQQLTADNLDEAMDGLAYEVADTFLEELDEDNIRVRFRELMTNSIFYTLSRRCGQEPMDVLDDDDFIRIVDFNKLPVLSFLGNAVSEQCEAVLFDIGREMRKIYKKEITQQLEKSVDSLYNTNTDFNALKRETKENTTKGGQENGVDVSSQGRLPVPESGREGRAADHREVRDAAQDVSEREPQELVSEYADERQAEPASGADRGSSGEPGGNAAGQPEREVPGTEQGERPAGMGSAPEQPDGDGRGDRLEGIGVQLTETTTEQDLSEAEEEIASAFSFPDLPTVEQQIRAIEAPIQARYADEIALDSEVVDEILRTGSNRSKGQLRLIYNFMVEKTPEEYTEFVKNEYGTGGKGFEIDGAKYAVWFDDLGLRIAVGSTAKGGTLANAFLSWEDVSNRIHELLRQGEYAPQAVLDAARQNALQEHAQTLAYMECDLADGVAEAVFQDTAIFRGGFPELTDRLAGLLDDTDFLTDLNDRLSALGEAYAEDKDLMRMHFYKPDKVAALFQQFAKPYQNYSARDGFHWNEYKKFITEDEINAYFTRGSNYSDSRLAIYSFFLNHEDKKVRADFLKDHYGIGGSSHALCGADDSHEDHDGRGIALERGPYGNPYANVHLNWNQAAGRIDRLIRDSEYLKPADYSRMPVYEREQMAMRVMGFYHHLSNNVERPYPQDLYHEEGRKALVEKLADTEQSAELLEQMDTALLSVPLDSEEYKGKAESLAILHQYVEGAYTIFPEKKRAVEIAVPEQGQMSIFDFMEQEPQSKEQSTAAAVENSQKAKVVARYQSTVMMQAGYIEDIAILQYPDGKFYNHYNYDEERGTGAAETGPFNSLNDAKSVIRQTREDAKAVESFENQPKQTYSRENGSFLYLENDHLYRIESSNAYDVYLKDMENSAVAGRVIPLPSYSETLAKNPLNDFLKLDADRTQKDSRSIYKECLYTLLEKVERSEIYPLLRDHDTTEEEAEDLIREKIEDLFASGEVKNAAYSEAIDTWAHFGEWIQEDIFQRTYQDVITDRRDAVALYQDSKDAPQWVRGMMVPYAEYQINVDYLKRVQPKDLDASEIEVRLGANWVKPEYITQFMKEVFKTPNYYAGIDIKATYSEISGAWNISGKSLDRGNPLVTNTYGTLRVNGYKLLEDALNLRDTKIYDTIHDADGDHRVLNKQETMLAQQAQESIREAFKQWIFKDLDRREDLCATYNRIFNAIRPREYDGSHIRFEGMTPEISLMPHQKNAVAHILYGNNTLLAHCVGAGKTFQMIAAGMESRRLGLSQKNLYVVPNQLTEQWGADFLRLYPNANVLVATKKDFEPSNRKQFCSRIATGDYDAIVIGHSQFERVPLSPERQKAIVERQIDDITLALADARSEDSRSFTVKQMEKTKKTLEAKLQKLNDQTRKDDVVTFEELGVDRLFVDESHFYKNMFLYTKMRNIAGIAQTDAQKSSDMFAKCQYLDELTGGKGVTFATGTPVSNSMVELYTIMRYLQYDTLQKMGLSHFDDWAASFGETVTAIKTMIHEVAHAMLHNSDLMKQRGEEKDRLTKETEAESIAFTVCSALGIDTSDYSFPYVASWASGKEMKELKDSMDTIRLTAADFLEKLEAAVAERSAERMTAMQYAEKLIANKEQEKTIFDDEQRNLIVNFAFKLDDRAATEELVNGIAAAVAEDDKEEVNRLMYDAQEKIENLPDGMIGLSEMHDYGYRKDDVLPLTKEGAREWHRLGEKIYPLFRDGTAGDYVSQEGIEQHDGIFGIKADAWDAILLEQREDYAEDEYARPDFKLTVINREQALRLYDEGKQIYLVRISPWPILVTAREEIERGSDTFQIAKEDLEKDKQKTMENGEKAPVEKLAVDLDDFAFDFDFYHYKDSVEDREQAVEALKEQIQAGDVQLIREWLQAAVEESEGESAEKAAELITRMDAVVKEQKLLSGSEKQFGIYQITARDPEHDYRFMNLDFVKRHGMEVNCADYELVYTEPLTEKDTLEAIYERFNIQRLADFTGHSLSVSDVVVLNDGSTVKAYYVDSIGFAELPEFFKERNIDLQKENLLNEELQEIEIFDKPGLFSNGRLRDEDVPDGLYRYDLRGSDYDPGQPITVEKTVVVNHAASVLMAEELDLGAEGRLELGEEGLNFTGAELTVREFILVVAALDETILAHTRKPLSEITANVHLVVQITRPQRRGQRVHTHEYDVHGVVLLVFIYSAAPPKFTPNLCGIIAIYCHRCVIKCCQQVLLDVPNLSAVFF